MIPHMSEIDAHNLYLPIINPTLLYGHGKTPRPYTIVFGQLTAREDTP